MFFDLFEQAPLAFVHKRIGGAIGGFVSGGFTGAASGFIRGGGGGRPSTRTGGQPTVSLHNVPRSLTAGCRAGQTRVNGVCRTRTTGVRGIIERLVPGGRSGFEPAGAAVMGQFGAALEPFVEDRMVRTCLPGMVLGRDGLCYNRRDLSNKERAYPKGTRPLGTPGEMAALRKAASFGRRMETTIKRMQKIGVIKKPAPRKAAPKMIGPGGPSHHHHGD